MIRIEDVVKVGRKTWQFLFSLRLGETMEIRSELSVLRLLKSTASILSVRNSGTCRSIGGGDNVRVQGAF